MTWSCIRRYVRYKWWANEPCMCALDHSNIIFLLEYSSVYSHSCFITDTHVCWRSLWGSVAFMCILNSLFLPRNYWWRRERWIRIKKRVISLYVIKWNLICDVEVCAGLFEVLFRTHPLLRYIHCLFTFLMKRQQIKVYSAQNFIYFIRLVKSLEFIDRKMSITFCCQHGIKCHREKKKL